MYYVAYGDQMLLLLFCHDLYSSSGFIRIQRQYGWRFFTAFNDVRNTVVTLINKPPIIREINVEYTMIILLFCIVISVQANKCE